ncbi:Mannan polymerase II complex anp1 subunit [Arachnomyces sp. PD_36]|nr:Mannan polymerase II complex anp1 subunit [Arachnomyces sp. PD_36]
MATPLIGTVIITGGNGALGSEIAIAIAKSQPLAHLLLVSRSLSSEGVKEVSEKIRLIGPRSLEIVKADLASFSSVTEFAEHTVQRVKRKDIPPVTVLINSAAMASYAVDDKTVDGFDPVYQTNCLSPFLLTVNLLEAFKAGGSSASDGGPRVINIGCSAIAQGRVDYFDDKSEWTSGGNSNSSNSAISTATTSSGRPQQKDTPLSVRKGVERFGSSKLLMCASMYALRRSLASAENISVQIFTLDPGGISGNSRLLKGTAVPTSVKLARQTRTGFGPLLRLFSKSSINSASVPAKIISKIAFQKDEPPDAHIGFERYFILDDEYEAGSVVNVLRDEKEMEDILRKTMHRTTGAGDLDGDMNLQPAKTVVTLNTPENKIDLLFQSRSQPALRRRKQLLQRLILLVVLSSFLFVLIFPSWRAAILPALSLGLVSSVEDFQLETVRYYDLSEIQGTSRGWDREERILLCTPLRDAASHLPMFFSHLRNLTYPHHLIDLAFLVSDSKDDTLELLSSMLNGLQHDEDPKQAFGEISVIEKDFGQLVQQDFESRHGFAAQASRRKLMARARNWLLSATLRPTHSWVYWRDADVETAPFSILEDLMKHNKDVIVPNVWRPLPEWLGGEQPYDLNSWQESISALELADSLDEDAVIVEGYAEYATWRPHLAYLRDPYGDPDMEMDLDGIGGVSILAKAKVFRSGVHFPAFSFERHAETEGFGKMAKRMDFSVVGLPHYTIWHLYEPSFDDMRHMEEMAKEKKEREEAEILMFERGQKIKEEFNDPKAEWQEDSAALEELLQKERTGKQ